MADLPIIQITSNKDCLIVARSEVQAKWLESPHNLYLLYPMCQKLLGQVNNIFVVSGPVYDLLTYDKAEIISYVKAKDLNDFD